MLLFTPRNQSKTPISTTSKSWSSMPASERDTRSLCREPSIHSESPGVRRRDGESAAKADWCSPTFEPSLVIAWVQQRASVTIWFDSLGSAFLFQLSRVITCSLRFSIFWHLFFLLSASGIYAGFGDNNATPGHQRHQSTTYTLLNHRSFFRKVWGPACDADCDLKSQRHAMTSDRVTV